MAFGRDAHGPDWKLRGTEVAVGSGAKPTLPYYNLLYDYTTALVDAVRTS